jgi:protein-L-isoaspartate(D-aspartate) O-methyltransferase
MNAMGQLSEKDARERMIRSQIIERGISDPRVLEAIRLVPREKFFADASEKPFADRAAPIGFGQTISQPYMVALMSEKLQLAGSERVLEIGTGSGYQTAILAKLAAEVYTIERIKPLLDLAFERLMDLNCRNVKFRLGDGTLGGSGGWAEAGPFDRIMITASAPAIPRALFSTQLKDGGLAILPVGSQQEQMLTAVWRRGDELEPRDISMCRFVPLIGAEGWPSGTP